MAKKNRQKNLPRLAKGQLWKLKHAYIQIVELGKRLLEFRMLTDLSESGVRPKMSGVETMCRYLQSRGARLIKSPHGMLDQS